MEEPVNHAAKRKPAFAFWERQRKSSTASLDNAAASTSASFSAAAAPRTSASPPAARHIDAFEPSQTTSASPSPSPLSHPTAAPALSGVQRLIQQYSQGGATDASASSPSLSPDKKSLSQRRPKPVSPHSDRFLPATVSASSLNTDGTADTSASPLAEAHSQLARKASVSSSHASQSTRSSVTPTSRLSTEAVVRESILHSIPASSAQSSPASTSTPDSSRQPVVVAEADAERAKARRRLLQEQLRKRNIKRLSASATDTADSLAASSDGYDQEDEHDDASAADISAALTPQARASSADGAESERYHDAPSHFAASSTAVANLDSDSSVSQQPQLPPPPLEDTRPWLEFSPLLPDDELHDGPETHPPPTLAALHHQQQCASSDISASASQSSLTTDPNATGSTRPSPSRSTSTSQNSGDSPVSPTGLGFSSPPGYPSTASYLSINSPTHASQTRALRSSKLPPPRPSPQAPLPPPPSLASFTVSAVSPGVPPSTAPAESVGPTRRSSSIRTAAMPADLLHGQEGVLRGQRARSGSYSLEQELASADGQHQPVAVHSTTPLSTSQSPNAIARTDGAQTPSSSALAVPMIRQRSDSLQRRDMQHAEGTNATPKPTKTWPPTSTSPTAGASSSRNSGSKPPVTGRPRGFTVGALPGSSSTVRGSTSAQTPIKSRPRSLLSNEVFPLDLAEPRYKSKSARLEDDDARKTYSLDVERRGSHRGPSATSIADRDSSSNSGDRLAPENTERRPSVGGRSRSGSSASLLQQVNSQPKSHASFVIAVVGHAHSGKSTVIKKGLRHFGLSRPHVLSEKVTSHSTVCVVDQEQRTIEVLEIDASMLLNGPSKRFAWPKFLPNIDAVILCYDASEITSFRGMSELLENFSVANLSTVMLACKSEIHPRAVDPYYASDMACIYNVGLAECTVQSDEGKKRMRDCFSYLVKEVAKARTGRARRGHTSTVSPASAAMTSQRSQSPGAPNPAALAQSRTVSSASQASSQSSLPPSMLESVSISGAATMAHSGELPSPATPTEPLRARGYSNASFSLAHALASSIDASTDQVRGPSVVDQATERIGKLNLSSDTSLVPTPQPATVPKTASDARVSTRKMSSATAASGISETPSFHSVDEDLTGLHDPLQRAQAGLQNARSSGGYVSIDELWDKLFHAAISRTDERFVTMFMVFYRGFATPMDLLKQMMARFDTLTAEDVADGIVHRFALIRLTNMLGDWVLDYPGDLSHPETHALLVSFHRQLLQNSNTVHTAIQIQAAVDATASAPDLDALWSKSVNTDKTRRGGIAAAIAAMAGNAQQDVDLAGGLQVSRSSGSASGFLPSSGNTSHDFDGFGGESGNAASGDDGMDDHERTGSESSLPTRSELGAGMRSRSASDLTASSTEGTEAVHRGDQHGSSLAPPGAAASGPSSVSGHTQGSSSSSSGAGAGVGSTLSGETPGSSTGRPLDQKATLRSLSNVLLDVDDEVIATELTRLEWAFFTAIQPRDLLRHILVPHSERSGPVSRSISHFNYISNWVCSMILAQGKTKHRARMLEKFFNIASILRHDNNYGSLNSVLAGLSKTSVHRLRQTRELLKGKSVNKAYASLVRLMSNERSSAAYRLALENSDGPTIPYVGVHLQDIISISDGNPSKRADGMIHWRKFSLMDEAVMAVARCQQYDRDVRPNWPVERLVMDVPVWDDDRLYDRSLEVEPRSKGGEGDGVAKGMKGLKGFLSGAP